jgi:hypothetical protein
MLDQATDIRRIRHEFFRELEMPLSSGAQVD